MFSIKQVTGNTNQSKFNRGHGLEARMYFFEEYMEGEDVGKRVKG